MNISQKGLEIIKKFEGFSPQRYKCPAGKPSIGYGHVLTKDEKYTYIAKETAEELLRQDIRKVEYTINRSVLVPLTQGQFDAIASLVYNWGSGNFLRSFGLKRLNKEDYEGALAEFSEVTRCNGQELPGLLRRREAEAKLFNEKPDQLQKNA